MLYGQIIAWSVFVYAAILAIITILCLIAVIKDIFPKILTISFVLMAVCLVIMFEAFILATSFSTNEFVKPLCIILIAFALFIWTGWVIAIFIDATN